MHTSRPSLIIGPRPPLLDIPVELLFTIIELAALHCRPSILAVLSKAIHGVVNAILYRTVVLDCPEDIALFYRTVRSKPPIFFAKHVRRLAVTSSLRSVPEYQIRDILTACTDLGIVTFPSSHYSITNSPRTSHEHDGPSEIILQSFEMGDRCKVPSLIINSDSLTHLRFCEPSNVWCSPSSMLASFGPLPHLTCLQLSRRAIANKDNDHLFMEDIRALLRCAMLKLLVVSIFPDRSWSSTESIADSYIWNLMCDIQDADDRVVVLVGRYGDWKKGWEALKWGQQPANFWAAALDGPTTYTMVDDLQTM